jgi:putative transposase
MMFAQITHRKSLRDIVNQLHFQSKRLCHIGGANAKRSTLADANNNRSAEFFQALFEQQYKKCAGLAPAKRFRFKNKLYSLDGSVIDLCLSLFPWAKFRKNKAGVKLHALLDHDGYIPSFLRITDAKSHEIQIARTLRLPKGSIVAFDKGYNDYAWFNSLNENQIFFVTRIKKNARYTVRERRRVIKSKGLTCDQTIRFTGVKTQSCPIPLRRIGYTDPETGKHYTFLTNNFELAARTIADIYKDRWQIEQFFKWIKQNLKVKKFFGTSKNAVMTQIWIAAITMLLLAYYKYKAKLRQNLSVILQLLQLNMFERRSIWRLFDPDPPKDKRCSQSQMFINFNIF